MVGCNSEKAQTVETLTHKVWLRLVAANSTLLAFALALKSTEFRGSLSPRYSDGLSEFCELT